MIVDLVVQLSFVDFNEWNPECDDTKWKLLSFLGQGESWSPVSSEALSNHELRGNLYYFMFHTKKDEEDEDDESVIRPLVYILAVGKSKYSGSVPHMSLRILRGAAVDARNYG